MKKIAFLVLLLTFSIFSAQKTTKPSPPEGKALVGELYGAGVTSSNEVLTVEALQTTLKSKDKVENVTVRGKVTEVCPKKGCWVSIETENNERFFVKMKDYAFFVPTALEAKTVLLEGVAENKMLSVEEARHYAEDAKRSQAEIDAITSPQREIRFMAAGIKVVE